MLEIQDLDIYDYLFLRREAFIWKLQQTEEGEEYLKNAYRLEQTELKGSARKQLRAKFGGKGGDS